MRNFEIDVIFVLIEIVRFRFFNRSESDLAATSPIEYCNKVRTFDVEIGETKHIRLAAKVNEP